MANDLPEIQFELHGLADGLGGRNDPAPHLDGDGLPEISFDLSFLDQREAAVAAIDADHAEVGYLEIGDDRQRQERDLQEGFRQRAAEIERCAAERLDALPYRFERKKVQQAS